MHWCQHYPLTNLKAKHSSSRVSLVSARQVDVQWCRSTSIVHNSVGHTIMHCCSVWIRNEYYILLHAFHRAEKSHFSRLIHRNVYNTKGCWFFAMKMKTSLKTAKVEPSHGLEWRLGVYLYGVHCHPAGTRRLLRPANVSISQSYMECYGYVSRLRLETRFLP